MGQVSNFAHSSQSLDLDMDFKFLFVLLFYLILLNLIFRKMKCSRLIKYLTKDQHRKWFEEVIPLIHSCVNGHNVCIFASGQTGSGKTYTVRSYVLFAYYMAKSI